jgi:hypothetical protein
VIHYRSNIATASATRLSPLEADVISWHLCTLKVSPYPLEVGVAGETVRVQIGINLECIRGTTTGRRARPVPEDDLTWIHQ